MPTLTSAREQYLIQQKLAVLAQAGASRAWANGTVPDLAALIAVLQVRAAQEADVGISAMLAEQGINDDPSHDTVPAALAGVASDGRSLQGLFDQADSLPSLIMMATTQVGDAARAQRGVSMAVRRNVTVYVRTMKPPSCSRCAILAGAVYRWSEGFQRHPRCDCINVPTTRERAGSLVTTPDELFAKGQITGLSEAEVKAIEDGADIGQVVNARAGMSTASLSGHDLKVTHIGTTRRGGFGRAQTSFKKSSGRYERATRARLMPESIYDIAANRVEAIRLLRLYGYIR